MTEGYHDTVLKGGSLNKTVLRTFDDGRQIVRKSVARNKSREYGFVRWYSQFKRLQRYNAIFPGLFPALLDAGVQNDSAYFEMEYVAESANLKDYLSSASKPTNVSGVLTRLLEAAGALHDHTIFQPFRGGLKLYFYEEVVQRLSDACENPTFRAFCERPEIVVNGEACSTLLNNMDWLSKLFERLKPADECYTHGNLTLENILYVPSSDRIIFIDPYEENVVDCREAEFSQVLQCSNQYYGFINDNVVTVDGKSVSFSAEIPEGLREFNTFFEEELARRFSDSSLQLIRALEASQFTRMLPFKVAAGDFDKAKYFYGVASKLVQQLRKDQNSSHGGAI